jgi:hypothetical protein
MVDHRRFWDAMDRVDLGQVDEIETALTRRMIDVFELDTSGLILDMTNFATFIDSTNPHARSPRGARPSRSATTCAWSAWASSPRGTAGSRCSRGSTRAACPT